MAATSSFIGGSPYKVTSGWTEALLTPDRIKVARIFWESPTIASSLCITKRLTNSTMEYVNIAAEVSGQSKEIEVHGWWSAPYIKCVPSGTLYIYLETPYS